jgi:DNA-binding MarR family transcriptional regulator
MEQDLKPNPWQLTSFVTFKLARLQASLNAQATAILKANAGLSLVEWRVLQTLKQLDLGSLTEIAELTQIDKGQLSRKISSMVKKNLLTQSTSTEDKRAHDLSLTDHAKEICDRTMPIMHARQKQLLANVSDDDLEAFYRVVDQLYAASKNRETP